MTLFAYRFPLDIVFRSYTSWVLASKGFPFRFSIALLKKNQEARMEFEQLLETSKKSWFI
jgi:hypothetical protein